jgi:hypothetical protein
MVSHPEHLGFRHLIGSQIRHAGLVSEVDQGQGITTNIQAKLTRQSKFEELPSFGGISESFRAPNA